MIGIILTGHGNFATGLASSVELIAGKVENFAAVDFIAGDGQEQLSEKLKVELDNFKELDGILIMSDLMGGTPFKTSVMESVHNPKVKVIAGTNLPMLIDACLSKEFASEIQEFALNVIEVGKDSIVEFEM